MKIGSKVRLIKGPKSYRKYIGSIGVVERIIKPKDDILYSVIFFDDILACKKEEIEDAPTEH